MSLLSSPRGYTFPSRMLPAQGAVHPLDLTRRLRLLGIPQWGFTGELCTESGNISPALIHHHCNISQPACWYLVLGTWQLPGHPLPMHGSSWQPQTPSQLAFTLAYPPACIQPGQGRWDPLSRVPSEAAFPCFGFPRAVPFLSFPSSYWRGWQKLTPNSARWVWQGRLHCCHLFTLLLSPPYIRDELMPLARL